MEYSVAMTNVVAEGLKKHLIRKDGQEDLCFALYQPSTGNQRFSGLIVEIILPMKGERKVRGNVSFAPSFFERIIQVALQKPGYGIAFLHSHPSGTDWQGMSPDDIEAESGMAKTIMALTKFPLVGMTVAGRTGLFSARFWTKKNQYFKPVECTNTRVVGKRLMIASPRSQQETTTDFSRTRQAWGAELQGKIVSVRVGIIGLGSVGSLVVEGLARMGLRKFLLVDGDRIQEHNLDRTVNAKRSDARKQAFKVDIAKRGIKASATANKPEILAIPEYVQAETVIKHLVDCDVIFSCVDRPLARHILNSVAFAHLIPVIDGGINISKKMNDTMRSADWGVYISSPGRCCLVCAGQYDNGDVQMEREGMLDDPSYMDSLPDEHIFKKKENVIVFSMALASQEILTFVNLLGSICGTLPEDEYRYSYPLNSLIQGSKECSEFCSYKALTAIGDNYTKTEF